MNYLAPRFLTYLIFSLCLICQLQVVAQVGIGTTNPQQDLHIAGSSSTIRIEGLNSTNNTNNDGLTESVVKVDSNGDLVIEKSPSSILDITGSFPLGTITISTPDGSSTSQAVLTGNFNISDLSFVGISYEVRIGGIQNTDGSILDDGIQRLLILQMYIDGTRVSRDSKFFTGHKDSAVSGSTASGSMILSGFIFKELAAGPHTYELRGTVYGNDFSFKADFGGSSSLNRFHIVEF